MQLKCFYLKDYLKLLTVNGSAFAEQLLTSERFTVENPINLFVEDSRAETVQ